MAKIVRVIHRNIYSEIETLALVRNKMVFLSGPRQSGKTTFAKSFLTKEDSYFNWDDSQFKRDWTKSNQVFAERILKEQNPILVFDEIHKNLKWKNQIKGFYDRFGDKIKIIITGSALFNTFRKGSDSLLGRFIHFHLHPFSLGELTNSTRVLFTDFLTKIESFQFLPTEHKALEWKESLFRWGGFPEPLLSRSDEIHAIWAKNRLELLVRQDLRDISQFLNHNQIEVLASLLPERVGSLFSIANLVEDLDVAHTTVTRWLNALQSVYYHFPIKPYSNKIVRSLKKEGKIYLYDWSVIEEKGARFENMVACHLLKLVDYFNDTGQADLSLYYIRNKEKEEIDFLLVQKKKPILTIEVKLSELNLDKTFLKFRKALNVPHVQIVNQDGIFRKYSEENACVVSFDRFFYGLP